MLTKKIKKKKGKTYPIYISGEFSYNVLITDLLLYICVYFMPTHSPGQKLVFNFKFIYYSNIYSEVKVLSQP